MALHELSNILRDFKNAYDGGFSRVESSKSDVSSGINTVINSLDQVSSKFSTASKDSCGKQLTSCVNLAKEGLNSVKNHVESDLDNLLSSAKELRSLIQEIENLIEQGKNWKERGYVNETKDGKTEKVLKDNDQAKIDNANREIDDKNNQGEAMLNAMSAAINGVAFGVIGNMKNGGSLGKSISYKDLYSFDWKPVEVAPVEETKPEQPGLAAQVGCAVVGGVQSVVKVAEGIFDAILTPFAGIVSLIKGDDDHFLTKVIKTDIADGTVGALGGLIAGSKEAYDNSTGKKIGSFAGSVVAHGALWAAGGGVLSALSVAGNREETLISEGNTVGNALWRGTLSGALSYGAAKVISGVTNKVAPAISNYISSGSNAVTKTINAATTSFKNWGSLSAGGKLVSAVASPLRGATKVLGKAISGGSKVVSKALNKTAVGRGLVSLDTKATELAQKVVDSTSNKILTGAAKLKPSSNKAITEYNDALEKWKNSGGNKTTAEYDKMQKAYDKMPTENRPELGKKALTTTEIDKKIIDYNKARLNWENAGKPASGSAEYDAMKKQFDSIPTGSKPSNVGDMGYTNVLKDRVATNYNDKLVAWKSSGVDLNDTTTTQYKAMQDAYQKLPDSMKSATNIGDFAHTTSTTDYLSKIYNDKLTDWRTSGVDLNDTTTAQYKAMQDAYNNIPESARNSINIGDVATTSGQAQRLIINYNNKLTDWYATGGKIDSSEYNALKDAFDKLPRSVRPENVGDAFGTFKNSELSKYGQMAGAIYMSSNS